MNNNNIPPNNNYRPPHVVRRKQKEEVYRVDPQKLRYAQASMKDETRNGLPIAELVENMLNTGFNKKYPIRVIHMPPGPGDSPEGKLVAFDTRRTKAARQADRRLLQHIIARL